MVGPPFRPVTAGGVTVPLPQSNLSTDRSSSPPEAWKPLARLARSAARPLERFLHTQATSGVLLLLAAALALGIANSTFASQYFQFWQTPIGIQIGGFAFVRSLEWVVNDGLMVLFFFVVGMEIRREIHEGELSEWRRATLPVAAALGGMAAPAGLYLLLANAPDTHSGWGVPMATDIAFAVGILAILGKRVPPALRVLLLALAVIDDLGAIVVIALFYSTGISIGGFVVAAIGIASVLLMQRMGVRAKLAYVPPSLIAWAGIYAAGVHPTIAGVVVGLITPVRAWLGPQGFVADARQQIDHLDARMGDSLSSHDLTDALKQVGNARREAVSPAGSLIEMLHPWVAFAIMPIFALANAGVAIDVETVDGPAMNIAAGVALGLLLGKPLGVLLMTWLAVKLRLTTLPTGITVRHLIVLGVVAGVGFTMSLFIAQLAFVDLSFLAAAKLGVLVASGLAGVLALALGWWLLPSKYAPAAATTVDEAERSTEQ
jgi:Na+:H+ antiporter, NhaA family